MLDSYHVTCPYSLHFISNFGCSKEKNFHFKQLFKTKRQNQLKRRLLQTKIITGFKFSNVAMGQNFSKIKTKQVTATIIVSS